MDRRTFIAGLAGSAVFARPAYGHETILEAIFGARLPQTLRITLPTTASLPSWFELRAYQCESPARFAARIDPVFARSGIHPVLFESATNLKYLIPFHSLAERNQAWTLVDADPEWHRLRDQEHPVNLCEVTIYRPILLRSSDTDPMDDRHDASNDADRDEDAHRP